MGASAIGPLPVEALQKCARICGATHHLLVTNVNMRRPFDIMTILYTYCKVRKGVIHHHWRHNDEKFWTVMVCCFNTQDVQKLYAWAVSMGEVVIISPQDYGLVDNFVQCLLAIQAVRQSLQVLCDSEMMLIQCKLILKCGLNSGEY